MKVQSTARVALLVMVPCLGACSSNPGKQDIGTVGGAAAGSYIGNRFAREMK